MGVRRTNASGSSRYDRIALWIHVEQAEQSVPAWIATFDSRQQREPDTARSRGEARISQQLWNPVGALVPNRKSTDSDPNLLMVCHVRVPAFSGCTEFGAPGALVQPIAEMRVAARAVAHARTARGLWRMDGRIHSDIDDRVGDRSVAVAASGRQQGGRDPEIAPTPSVVSTGTGCCRRRSGETVWGATALLR